MKTVRHGVGAAHYKPPSPSERYAGMHMQCDNCGHVGEVQKGDPIQEITVGGDGQPGKAAVVGLQAPCPQCKSQMTVTPWGGRPMH